MKQFLITTDIHYTIGQNLMEEAQWFLDKFGSLFPKFVQRSKQDPKNHILETLKEAGKHGPYDGLLDIGDRTHGSKKDTGLSNSHAVAEARGVLQLLKDSFKEISDKNLYLVAGNHDLGWALSSFTRWGTGYQLESLAKYREIYGPLFGSNKLTDDIVLIRIASEPFFYDYKRPLKFKGGEEEKIIKQRLQLLRSELATQLFFVKKTLEDIESKNQRFILAVHEPSALLSPQLQKLLDKYRSRLIVTLTGHVHARWLINLIKLFQPGLRNIYSYYRIQMIPSVWGVDIPNPGLDWGPGAGWARLTIEDKAITLYIYHTNKKRFTGIALT